jgi:hypothetical protein
MQMLILVLNNVELLEPLLETMTARGLKGATIFNSTGMVRELTRNEDYPLFGSLRFLMTPEHEESKTLFMVLPEEKVSLAKETIRDILGDLSRPNTGVMFTLPVIDAEGIAF